MKVIKICVMIFILAVLCPAAFGDEVISGEGWTVTVKEIPYGDGPGEVGAKIWESRIEGTDGGFLGPKTFTLDEEGNVYILDNINKRVQVYTSVLEFLYSVPIQSQWGEYMAVDDSGRIYILYQDNEMHQYDKEGNLLSSIRLDPERLGSRMFVRGNKIYMKVGGDLVTTFPGHLVIAKITGTGLKEPSEGEKKLITTPLPENSGRRYLMRTSRANGYGREIDEFKLLGPNNEVIGSFAVEFPSSIGVWHLLGDDQSGRLYYEIMGPGRDTGGKKITEIRQYGPDGESLRAARLPEMNLFFSRRAHEFLRKDGTFYEFVPEREILKIIIVKFH